MIKPSAAHLPPDQAAREVSPETAQKMQRPFQDSLASPKQTMGLHYNEINGTRVIDVPSHRVSYFSPKGEVVNHSIDLSGSATHRSYRNLEASPPGGGDLEGAKTIEMLLNKQLNLYSDFEHAKQKMPVTKTNFHHISENYFLKYIHQYGNPKNKDRLYFQLPEPPTEELLSHKIQSMDMFYNQRAERKLIIETEVKHKKQLINDDFKFFNVKDPYGKIKYFYFGEGDAFHQSILSEMKDRELRNFVKIENFKEDTRQWQLTYDPFSITKMLQIYGDNPPHSFVIRQELLLQQRIILERYSFPRPIVQQDLVNRQIQEETTKKKRDYIARKAYLRYTIDQRHIDSIKLDLFENPELVLENPLPPTTPPLEFYPVEYLEEIHAQTLAGRDRVTEVQPEIEQRFEELAVFLASADILTEQFCASRDQTDFAQRYLLNNALQASLDFDSRRGQILVPRKPAESSEFEPILIPKNEEVFYRVSKPCYGAIFNKWILRQGALSLRGRAKREHRVFVKRWVSAVLAKDVNKERFIDNLLSQEELEEMRRLSLLRMKSRVLPMSQQFFLWSLFRPTVQDIFDQTGRAWLLPPPVRKDARKRANQLLQKHLGLARHQDLVQLSLDITPEMQMRGLYRQFVFPAVDFTDS